jgi:protein-S-isoprenylcysteine O-methyltransferase Ste14
MADPLSRSHDQQDHRGEVRTAVLIRWILSLFIQMAIFGGLLAGTLRWWRAWVLLGVVLVAGIAILALLFSGREDLLYERFKSLLQRREPRADKLVLLLTVAAILGMIVFIPLDVFRFHLMGTPGAVVSSLGLVLFAAGWWIIFLALRENPLAARVAKHQQDKRQRVIEPGVDAVERHPMYAGAALLLVGMPLWLESYAAAMLASIPIALLVMRILTGERSLR